jgi:hypothetical protein
LCIISVLTQTWVVGLCIISVLTQTWVVGLCIISVLTQTWVVGLCIISFLTQTWVVGLCIISVLTPPARNEDGNDCLLSPNIQLYTSFNLHILLFPTNLAGHGYQYNNHSSQPERQNTEIFWSCSIRS